MAATEETDRLVERSSLIIPELAPEGELYTPDDFFKFFRELWRQNGWGTVLQEAADGSLVHFFDLREIAPTDDEKGLVLRARAQALGTGSHPAGKGYETYSIHRLPGLPRPATPEPLISAERRLALGQGLLTDPRALPHVFDGATETHVYDPAPYLQNRLRPAQEREAAIQQQHHQATQAILEKTISYLR